MKPKRSNVVWFATLLWWLLTVPLALSAATTPPMRFDRISVDQGLSQSAVLSILQDQTGFMWFGTEDGLNRYDGLGFRLYNHDPSNADSISNDFVLDLVEDSDGRLWAATDGGGLQVLDPQSGKFEAFTVPGGVEIDAHLRALHIDGQGNIWVASRTDGAYLIEAGTGNVRHFAHDPQQRRTLSNDQVFVMISAGGQLWLGTEAGLNRLDPATGTVTRFDVAASGLCHDDIHALAAGRDGTIWIGTHGGGLCSLSPETGEVKTFRHVPDQSGSLSSDRVSALLLDDEGRLWIGTDGGLNLLIDRAAGIFARFRNDSSRITSLSADVVVSLYSDRSGVLWVGTKHGGVNKWNPRTWAFNHQLTQPSDGFSSTNVSSFAEDSNGNLWVGSVGGGVTVVQRGSSAAAPLETKLDGARLSDSRVMSLLSRSDGQMWVGTMGGGLNRVDPQSGAITLFRHDPSDDRSIGAKGIMSLFEDDSGQLWVGTFGGGVNRYLSDEEGFERHAPDPADSRSISAGRATALGQSADGVIWAGTDGGGLNYLQPDGASWGHYRYDASDPDSISSDTIYAIYGAPDGVLWVGTRGGLDRLDPNSVKFKHLSMADGLPNDSIYGILPDSEGRLWLTSNRGLSRFAPATGEIRNYNRSHGLQGDEFNFGAWHRSSRGELIVGGAGGYNRFLPSELTENQLPPPVVLTGFELFNQTVELDTPVQFLERFDLDYTDDVMTFEFVALDYSAPQDNLYRYRLEGFDDDWVQARGVRRATYTNLDGGDYLFRVIAANSDGVWNEEGLSLALRVAPPPWATTWAYLLYVLAGAGLVAVLVNFQRLRLAREIAFRERLQHEVSERTSELAQSNSRLRDANESLERASLTDPLTGLNNRRFVATEVEREITLIQRHYADAEAKKVDVTETLAFVMVDLDHFKPINDKFGHASGDRILLSIADILNETCRNSDFVVRWGGDEFLVVGRHNNANETAKLAERIRSRIADQIFSIGGGNVARTTASIGFACYPFLPHDAQRFTWEQVAAIADAALYRAKQWRNAWVGYFPTPATAEVGDFLALVKRDADRLSEEGCLDIRESRHADQQASSA